MTPGAGPGSVAHLTGAQGLVRERSPGGARPGQPRPAGPGLLGDGVPSGGRCRLLGVFAHPDDETFCAGGTFARYAEQSAEIMVVSATRGQAGQIRDAAAGTRRTIAAVREAELRLACERLAGTPAFAHALLLLAEAARTMRHIRDHVQVRWYPPGSYVVEQGEAAAELFLILSGEAEVWKEGSGGRREQLRRVGVGEFFGEAGIARHRSADVVATGSLTCLVLSAAPPAKFAGRGRGARLAGAPAGAPAGARANASPAAGNVRAGQGVVCCDVSEQVRRKVGALSAHRSQFPLEPDMFPEFLLQEMFGCEYFVAVPTGRTVHLDEVPVLEPELRAPLPAR